MTVFYLFGLLTCLYLLTAAGNIVFDSDSSSARYEVTRSMVERFDVAIPDDTGLRGKDGRDYSWYGLGYSLLSVPFYLAGKWTGISPETTVSILNQLAGAATGVVLFLFSNTLGYSRRASLTVTLFYSLGTMAWPLTKQPFDHTVETLFVLLSVYLSCRHLTEKKPVHILLAGLSLGTAFMTRPTAILAIPPLMLLLYTHRSEIRGDEYRPGMMVKCFVLFLMAFLPCLLVSMWYNYYRFGSILESGPALMGARTGVDFFTGTPFLTGLAGFLTSPGKGLFFYSPIALLFFVGIRPFYRRYPGQALCFIMLILSYLFFHSKNVYWHGDWGWGPRYLLASLPFFIIPAAELLDSPSWRSRSARRNCVYFLFAVSVVIQLAAVSVNPAKYFVDLQVNKGIKFTVASGKGVQPIIEPPIENYFHWHRSPILAQFGYVYKMAANIKTYQYLESSDQAGDTAKSLKHNVFEFWWLYIWLVKESYEGFAAATALLLLSLHYTFRLRKLA